MKVVNPSEVLGYFLCFGGLVLLFSYFLRVGSRPYDAAALKINVLDKDLKKADKRIGIIALLMFFGGLVFLLLGGYIGF